LYFLKDYEGAVDAYQDAILYEPENHVTQTYLAKAQAKVERSRRKSMGEELSVATSTGESHMHYAPSVATDPHGQHSVFVGKTGGYQGRASAALVNAVAARKEKQQHALPPRYTSPTATTTPTNMQIETTSLYSQNGLPGSVSASSVMSSSLYQGGFGNASLLGHDNNGTGGADPDFDEALRIQQQANQFLTKKQYKAAMEEYTAALFLVPDDINLSSELHLGRAHALNGSRRHERARNDAIMALKLKITPAAYSTLAKSYFYMKDYRASIQAFEECIKLLPPDQSLGLFDRAYMEKAEAALDEEEASLNNTSRGGSSVYTNKTVPKLPPPRFVPRDQAIQAGSNLPSMPKQWPLQSPRSPKDFRCGPEREIMFLSESLGIKLNRGSDGVVRVLSVLPSTPASPLARRGEIVPGDVVRECAGVDLRRPITNIMWGDTVALVKMAPRPITFIVAKEVSEVPPIVLEEMRRVDPHYYPEPVYQPSNANGDEPVREDTQQVSSPSEELPDHSANSDDAGITTDVLPPDSAGPPTVADAVIVPVQVPSATLVVHESASTPILIGGDRLIREEAPGAADDFYDNAAAASAFPPSQGLVPSESLQMRGLEDRLIGGQILFQRSASPAYFGWDNLRWLAYSGVRKVAFTRHGFRLVEAETKQLFWSTAAMVYEERLLAIYKEPSLILLLRRPKNEDEVAQLLGLSDSDDLDESERSVDTYWIVESVAEPATCLLKLSPLTSVFSIPSPDADERRSSCLELRTPVESIVFTGVRVRDDVQPSQRSCGDSGAFLEALATEKALRKCLCGAHASANVGVDGADTTWQHQVIQGTLHSVVVSGNFKVLDVALAHAIMRAQADTDGFANVSKLPSRIIDEPDKSGYPPIYYAVTRGTSQMVSSLVKAGASIEFRDPGNGMTLLHLCAGKNAEGLAVILASDHSRPNPNALDSMGRTPMYLACIQGSNARILERCLELLDDAGGTMIIPDSLVPLTSPVAVLAALWRSDELLVVLKHLRARGLSSHADAQLCSLSATNDYPIHVAVASITTNMLSVKARAESSGEASLIQTLQVLFHHGFEPNERVDHLLSVKSAISANFVGYTPLQVLVSVALLHEALRADVLLHQSFQSLVKDAAYFLLRHGARTSVDAPVDTRPCLNAPTLDMVRNNEAEWDKLRDRLNWSSKLDFV
jgi:tetratricopeptide (TPR) repeat protein/ankyrin repeat protein